MYRTRFSATKDASLISIKPSVRARNQLKRKILFSTEAT